MSIKDLAKSILFPKDKKVVIDGALDSSAPLHTLLGDSLFKKVVIGSFVSAVLLSGAGNAFATPNPLDLISPPSSVEITHNSSYGNHFERNGLFSLFEDNESMHQDSNSHKGTMSLNSFVSAVLSAGSGSAILNPLDLISPPSSVEITHDSSYGNHFESFERNGLFSLFEDNESMHQDSNDYKGTINLNSDYTIDYFANAGATTSDLEGLDTSDFNDLNQQSKELMNYVDVNSTPIHMNKAELADAGDHIKQAFYDLRGDTPFEDMSDSTKTEIANEILLDIKSDKNASKLLEKITLLSNQFYASENETLDIDFVKNIMKLDSDVMSRSISRISDLDKIKDNYSTKNMVDHARYLGFHEIYSNIAEHYDLNELDIESMFRLSVVTHEYVHMVDDAKNMSTGSMKHSWFKSGGDTNDFNSFKLSESKEAFADLASIPISVAVYAKSINKSPEDLSDALLDTFLTFRTSTFKANEKMDSHIGAVNSILYWDNHRDQLLDESMTIFNDLPDTTESLSFERDIVPHMLDIYNNVYASDEFQQESFSSDSTTLEGLKDDYSVAAQNSKVRSLDALSNVGYKIIFDGHITSAPVPTSLNLSFH